MDDDLMDLLIADVSNISALDVPKLPIRKYYSLLEHSLNINNYKRGGELKYRNSESETKAVSNFIEKKKRAGKIKSLKEQGIR